MEHYEYDVFLSDDQTARQLAEDGKAFLDLKNDFASVRLKIQRVCQNAGVADAIHGRERPMHSTSGFV
jgi:hypothetical protein